MRNRNHKRELQTFQKIKPTAPVLGVEIEPERIEAAKPFEEEPVSFRLGGFNLPLGKDEPARLIRAFNVLRQYDEQEVAAAYQAMQPKRLWEHNTAVKF